MADWSTLPKEIVTKIVEHVELYEDFETLRWICMAWRSAAKEANLRACVKNNNVTGHQEQHTLPWLMQSDLFNTRCLYSLSKHMVRELNLPCCLDDKYDKITFASSFGWLLVVSGRRNPCLLYPFSGAIIKLPTVKFSWKGGLRSYYWHHKNECKLTLSANPLTSSDYTVFLSISLFNRRARPVSIMVFWWNNNGDDRWIQALYPDPWPTPGMPFDIYSLEAFLYFLCQDVTCYQGEFYGINTDDMIVKFDTAQNRPYFQGVAKILFPPINFEDGERYSCYLVASGCQLLLVRQVKWLLSHSKCKTTRFELFELNVKNGDLNKVSCLGNRAIFLGWNSSFSVEITSRAHGLKPNCIYYSETQRWYHGRGRDHCVYHLLSNKVERRFYNAHSSHFGTHFMWVESPIYLSFMII